MSVLLAITDSQGLIDGAIISVAILLILSIGAWMDRHEQKHWNRPLLVPEDLKVLDHDRCVHVDEDGVRCTTVLCFCIGLDVDGLPIVCTQAEAPACSHSLVSRATTGGHCYRHVSVCPDCRVDDASMWGHVR